VKRIFKYLRFLLLPVSAVYYAVMGIRNLFYDIRIFKTHHIPHTKIISVGNISVGGTGKTPLVQYIACFLHSKNKKISTLSRGYKRQSKGYLLAKDYTTVFHTGETVGDEPTQYVHNLPFAAVAVCEKRVIGANALVQSLAPDIIILDDAFQHRSIARDINIVVLDYNNPPWKDFILPAGNLREPMISIERADMVIINKVKYEPDVQKKLSLFEKHIQNIKPNLPVCICSYRPENLINIGTGTEISVYELEKKRVFAICGIGNPDYFVTQLEELKADIPTILTLKDHRSFDEDILQTIEQEVKILNPDYIVCTEKDFYRFRYTPAYQILKKYTNFYYMPVQIAFWGDDETKFKDFLIKKIV
jgi:tetraacyldisaccharide 4'-kinase